MSSSKRDRRGMHHHALVVRIRGRRPVGIEAIACEVCLGAVGDAYKQMSQ